MRARKLIEKRPLAMVRKKRHALVESLRTGLRERFGGADSVALLRLLVELREKLWALRPAAACQPA